MLDRRRFLEHSAVALGLAAFPVGLAAAAPRRAGFALPDVTVEALRSSPYVYVSPLRSDGGESKCHGEVWYGWLDGSVVCTVAHDRWKARAIRRGLDRARIWVGDHGRWKGLTSNNEAFRQAPHFDAKAELVGQDKGLLERLLVEYERKYPQEIGRWRDRMRQGQADGSRVLVRYTPAAAGLRL
ncbi:MAG: hypothetical protein MJE66_03180 [Proteobacteria bacterium]|nr:hypothetical protein [Pseudomonadota bacterium]